MEAKLTLEQKEKFFQKWEEKHLKLLTKEKAEEIMEFAINKKKVFIRDNNQCQNEWHNKIEVEEGISLTIHHITPQYDFKLNPNLSKYLGYTVHSMKNMITLCTCCHQYYEKAKGPIKLIGYEIPYLKEKSERIKYKDKIRKAKALRKSLKNLGTYGWGKIIDEDRWKLVASLMWFVFEDWETTAEFDN